MVAPANDRRSGNSLSGDPSTGDATDSPVGATRPSLCLSTASTDQAPPARPHPWVALSRLVLWPANLRHGLICCREPHQRPSIPARSKSSRPRDQQKAVADGESVHVATAVNYLTPWVFPCQAHSRPASLVSSFCALSRCPWKRVVQVFPTKTAR